MIVVVFVTKTLNWLEIIVVIIPLLIYKIMYVKYNVTKVILLIQIIFVNVIFCFLLKLKYVVKDVLNVLTLIMILVKIVYQDIN
jgi:hypothetical protein